jgi:hypothetical protein
LYGTGSSAIFHARTAAAGSQTHETTLAREVFA